MRHVCKIVLVALGAVLLFAGKTANAEDRAIQAKPPIGAIFDTLPQPLPESPGIYVSRFQGLDPQIESSYRNQWLYSGYSDRISPYFSSLGDEEAARTSFASGVFRLRVDTTIRSLLTDKSERPTVARAYYVSEKIKNVEVKLDPQGRTQLKVGYDFVSDCSKLEFVQDGFNLGVYQSDMTALASGDTSVLSKGIVKLGGKLRADLPVAAVAFGLAMTSFQSSLTHPISRRITGQIATTQPLGGAPIPTSYEFRIYYPF